MDITSLIKSDDKVNNEIFAKRDILTKPMSRRERRNQAKAAAESAPADGAAKKEGGAASFPGKKASSATMSVAADGSMKRRKKHLSHKKDPVSFDETRRTVFVGNLPNTVSHKQVSKFFEGKGCGEVEAARVRCIRLAPLQEGEKDRGRGVRILRGEIDERDGATATAYVVFKTEAGADAAVAQTGSVFKDRHLSVTGESPEAKAFEPRSSVYMGNLPYDVSDEDVWTFFIDHGVPDITRVRVVRDPTTGKAKGFGYVEFATRESVVKALKLRQPTLHNRTIRIFSVQKSRDPNIQHTTRRDKRAVAAVSATKKTSAVIGGGGADSAGKKQKKQLGGGASSVVKASAAAVEQPSWMGATADPRKKLSKELRWLTQDPTSRKAAAKSRHKDRVRANFIKKKKEGKAQQ